MLAIPAWLQTRLRTKPEYAMGYQRGIAKLSTGQRETGIILNSSTFLKEDEVKSMSAAEMRIAESNASFGKSALSILDIDLIPRSPESLRGVRRISITEARQVSFSGGLKALAAEYVNELRAKQAAKDAPITASMEDEVFKRFSAYVSDFRITPNHGLSPGTFATTAEDAEHVKTGRDAVARYALENKDSANKVFTIKPPEATPVQRGIVESAYGEPGGGVEVIFVNGSPDNTVTGPVIIPE